MMKTDIEIAQEAVMKPITEVAAALDITQDELELYGKYKAKLSSELWEKIKDRKDGKLVLVTAINPTPAGEGKTTTTVGQAWQKSSHRPSGAFSWAVLRHQRRRSRRRLRPGCSHGRFKSAFYR